MIQRLIKEADKETIDQFLRWSRTSPNDPDSVAITDYIIEEGMTCHTAAKKRFLTGRSRRSLSALQYRAKCIEVELMKRLGHRSEDYLKKLMQDGSVIVPIELVANMRESCQIERLIIEEHTHIEIVGRRNR